MYPKWFSTIQNVRTELLSLEEDIFIPELVFNYKSIVYNTYPKVTDIKSPKVT